MSSIGNPLVVLWGPTAIGKTDLAIQLGVALNGEIVSADSRQIYREMSIGTAKPTPTQQQAAVHHLIDVVDPYESLSLAQYQDLAYAAIDAILDRGNLPLLVGGTGQYITALIEGWLPPRVPPNPQLRSTLEDQMCREGVATLHQQLQQLDPNAAIAIHPNNGRRIIRALEVILTTGKPISALPRKNPPNYHIRHYGLSMERSTLYARADQRVDHMIEHGFLDEVQHLLDKGYDAALPAMSGVGYRQMIRYLHGDVSLDEAIETTKYHTHAFIRRQETWFRKHNNEIIEYDACTVTASTVIDHVLSWLDTLMP